MANFTLHVKNLRALRSVTWSPRGISVLVGANGVGKSTVLQALKLLRAAFDQGLPRAVISVLQGSYNLRNWSVTDDQPIELGVSVDNITWRLRLTPRGSSVDHVTSETLEIDGQPLYTRDELGNLHSGDRAAEINGLAGIIASNEQTILRGLADNSAQHASIRQMAAFLRNITVFQDPDLWSLKNRGSLNSDDLHLHSRGTNAITMLRKWYQERPHRFRYQFVFDGLRAAFPGKIADLDFKEAGQTLVMQVFRPGHEAPGPLISESNGFAQMLLLLCDLASAEENGVVAIDEPENSLHPYAIREFLRRVGGWSQKRRLTVLLATHSPVLLDELTGTPEQVFVLHPEQDGPTRIDIEHNRNWLANFRIGELYVSGDLGSNNKP